MCGWIFISKPAARAARSTMAWKPRFANGVPRSLTNTNGDTDPCSRCSRRRARSSRPVRGCVAGVPCFDSTDVQDGVFQVHLLPAKVHQLRGPQTVPEGQQHHGCVTMAPAVVLGGLN